MEDLYFVGNFATLASAINPVAAPTTVAVNVQLQLAAITKNLCIVEYGISFATAPAGALVTFREAASAATLTACMTPTLYSNPNAPASLTTTTTTTTAFNSTSTAVSPATSAASIFDAQLLSTNTYVKQFPLGREPTILAGDFAQIVVTAGAISTAYAYFIWRE